MLSASSLHRLQHQHRPTIDENGRSSTSLRASSPIKLSSVRSQAHPYRKSPSKPKRASSKASSFPSSSGKKTSKPLVGHTAARHPSAPALPPTITPVPAPAPSRQSALGLEGPLLLSSQRGGTACLPLALPRPSTPANIRVGEIEALEGIPISFTRQRLSDLGPILLRASLSAHLDRPAQTLLPPLPAALPFTFSSAPEIASLPPTHVFAVRPSPGAPASAGNGTLLPFHDLVYRCSCSHLPALPPAHPSSSSSSSNLLPVVHLTLPSPSTLPLLNTFLYTARPDLLLSSLLSLPPSASASSGKPAGTRAQLMEQLATGLDLKGLLDRVAGVHGLWGNVCALGIAHPSLWKAMDTAWEVLVGAIALLQARGAAHSPPAPAPSSSSS